MRRLLPGATLLLLIASCGTGDPPAPQFNLDGFQPSDALEDAGGGADTVENLDTLGDLPADLPPDQAEPDGIIDVLDVTPDAEPGCVDDDDCLDAFETIPECLRPECALEVCALVPVEDGEPCGDDNPCVADPTCLEGICTAGTILDCDDDDPCTDDTCTDDGGCAYAPNTAACDDGVPCTVEDICAEGTCAGTVNSCDDDNPCTFDGCEPVTGQCLHEAAAIPCDDGDACTANDFCEGDLSTGISAVPCDDGNPCTDDSCEPLSGCVHAPNDEPCDDSEICTLEDLCVDGVCTGLENACLCDDDGDCLPLQDDDLCNGSLACLDGLCQLDDETVVACDDPDTDDCVEFACDPPTGTCKGISKEDDATCDDHDVCTLAETCQVGLCTPEGAVDCDDGQGCTTDVCDPDEGCLYSPSLIACDDGNPCTVDDACTEEIICIGVPADCDDGAPCTLDGCDEDTGVCVHTPKVCDDENLCTVDLCNEDSGACLFATKWCSDGNLCTLDSCDPETGECGNVPKDCSDSDLCTQDLCGPDTGQCSNPPVTCDDADPCTVDSCNPDSGACVFQSPDCDDGDPCTEDALDCETLECDHSPKACNDENACTTDSCNPGDGACLHTPLACDDQDLCTTDSCDPQIGCVFSMVDCDDHDLCTTDSCAPDTGCGYAPAICDDETLCTEDSCAPLTGCAYSAIDCDDDDLCTVDSCEPLGGCVHTSINCDDANGCTDDACDPLSGCIFTPNDDPCDDGDACTGGDVCEDGTCVGMAQLLCTDQNPCTDDTCDPQSGCVFTPNDAPCDDGDACTENDICAGGDCTGPDQTICDDGEACTGDTCDPSSGCVHPPLTGGSCDDGDACTVGDVCAQGTCGPGQDACAPCEGLLDGDPCDDDDAQTLADMCVAGACAGWTRESFEPRPGTVSGTLSDVTWSGDRFFAVGHDEALTSNGGQETYTWAVTLDGGNVALYHDDSERTDTIYVAVSDDLAVGGDGATSHFDGGSWVEAEELQELLEEGITFDEISTAWGGRFQEMSNNAMQVDRWWFLGRNTADTLGLTKLCSRESWPGGAVAWECEPMYVDTYSEYEYPAAMDAVLEPAGGGWQIDRAYLVSDALSQLGNPTTFWLDAFTTADFDEWNFLGYLSDQPPYEQDWDDVTAVSGAEAWAVGSHGLVARIHEDEITKVSAAISPALAQVDWTSVFTLGDLVVITGVQTVDSYSPQGLLRTRSFLVRTHRGNSLSTGWNVHILGSESTICDGWWTCDGIEEGNHLTESATHGSEAYLVGRGWVPEIFPDEDGPSAEALVYHLDVPTL